MLKGLVLVGLLVATWAAVQGTVFQLRAPRKAFASMVAWFAPMLPAYVLLYLLTPPDLGFLPERFALAATTLGLLNGLAVWSCSSLPACCSTITRTGPSRYAS